MRRPPVSAVDALSLYYDFRDLTPIGRKGDEMIRTLADRLVALDLLDQALVIAPHYPEAWNRRATLNFSMNRLGKSLVDIEQTLLREPRHWGALMGLAMILEQTGRKEQALETYLRVLAVYPALDSAQDAAGRLSEELLGPAI